MQDFICVVIGIMLIHAKIQNVPKNVTKGKQNITKGKAGVIINVPRYRISR